MTDPESPPKTLKQLQKETPSGEEIAKRLAMAQLATDYEAAMLSASLLEFTLKQIIILKFVPLGKERIDGIFDDNANGPLSTFSSKIRMAHALGLIDNEMRLQFEVIKTIRNHFAHHHNNVHFDDPQIAHECAKLKEMKIIPDDIKKIRAPGLTPKLRYVQVCFVSATSFSQLLQGFKINESASGPLSLF